MRAHFEEENARAALLLEQAAFALLALRPAMVRKFAFQIVLAGLRYYSCGQKRLAIHAYRCGAWPGPGPAGCKPACCCLSHSTSLARS
jgi:hypothetical protein